VTCAAYAPRTPNKTTTKKLKTQKSLNRQQQQAEKKVERPRLMAKANV
jgi:hypothetical protein